jgi:hypothetical protein
MKLNILPDNNGHDVIKEEFFMSKRKAVLEEGIRGHQSFPQSFERVESTGSKDYRNDSGLQIWNF